MIVLMLFSNIVTAYALGVAPADQQQSMAAQLSDDVPGPCLHDAQQHSQNDKQVPRGKCCEQADMSKGDCKHSCAKDCNRCPMQHAGVGMITRFENEVFVHIASHKHFTPLLFSSSALTNLYRPPRMN